MKGEVPVTAVAVAEPLLNPQVVLTVLVESVSESVVLTTTLEVAVQLLASLTVTIYVVVDAGVTTGLALEAPPGNQA